MWTKAECNIHSCWRPSAMLSWRSSRGSTDPPLVACLLSRSGCNPGIVPGAGAYRAAGSAGASGGGGRRRVLAPLASDVRGRRARPAPVARGRRAGRVVRPRDLSVHPRPAHVSRDSPVARGVSAAEDAARRAPVRRSGACAPAPVWPRLPRGPAVRPAVVGCAKSRLVGGEYGKVGAERGSSAVLTDEGTRVGDGTPDAAWGQTGLRVARGTLSIGRRRSSSCSRAPVAFAFQSRSGSAITRRRRCGTLTTPTRYRWRCGTIRGSCGLTQD